VCLVCASLQYRFVAVLALERYRAVLGEARLVVGTQHRHVGCSDSQHTYAAPLLTAIVRRVSMRHLGLTSVFDSLHGSVDEQGGCAVRVEVHDIEATIAALIHGRNRIALLRKYLARGQ